MRRFLTLLSAVSGLLLLVSAQTLTHAAALPEDKSAVTILAYHRIGEDVSPHNSLTTSQFAAHIKAIEDGISSGSLHVISLRDILEHWKKTENLPPNTIAITFEGSYRSAYENGMQLLLEKNIPFTILYTPEHTPSSKNSGHSQHIDWKTLKNLAKNKNVTLGITPAEPARNSGKDIAAIRNALFQAITRHKKAFKNDPLIFSYPFGEYSSEYKSVVEQSGFKMALGLHSGTAHKNSDIFSLPRFSMTEHHSSIERFHLVTKALPLPAYDATPQDTLGNAQDIIDMIGFSVPENLTAELKNLSCFVSGQENPHIEIIGNRVEIRPQDTILTKTRINCTLPFRQKHETLWRWQGFILNPL